MGRQTIPTVPIRENIHTHHRYLTWLFSVKAPERRLNLWRPKLEGYNYKPGELNKKFERFFRNKNKSCPRPNFISNNLMFNWIEPELSMDNKVVTEKFVDLNNTQSLKDSSIMKFPTCSYSIRVTYFILEENLDFSHSTIRYIFYPKMYFIF